MATESSSSVASAEVSGGDHGGLKVGYHTAQGLRDSMEDHLVVIRDIPGGFLYAGIFDGHAGSASARFLKDELYIDCMDALEGGALLSDEDLDAVEEALQDAFIQADQRLLQWLAEHSEEPESGSTGTVAFVRKDRLFIAHLGDSRAVLGVGGDTEDLSQDHKPHGESPIAKAEIKRIEKAGGWVSQGRVCGVVAVSRAFGNANFKTRREQMLSEGVKKGRWTTRFVSKRSFQSDWISAVPDVYAAEVEEDAEFVIIASDGLWEGVKSSEAVAFVRRELESHGDIQQATDNLASFALQTRQSAPKQARGRSVSGGGVDGDTWRGGWERGDAWRMAGKASSAKLREAFKYCVDQVSAVFLWTQKVTPAQHSPTQFALRAFNVETSLVRFSFAPCPHCSGRLIAPLPRCPIAPFSLDAPQRPSSSQRCRSIPDRAREHRLAIIRLAWWRDALTRLFQGQPPEDHPVLVALGAVREARPSQLTHSFPSQPQAPINAVPSLLNPRPQLTHFFPSQPQAPINAVPSLLNPRPQLTHSFPSQPQAPINAVPSLLNPRPQFSLAPHMPTFTHTRPAPGGTASAGGAGSSAGGDGNHQAVAAS
ncbi:unnamed protein product [Closterium sp. NIES-65]|nr:unnamed protein product [Closterium sp. NIES-65]